MATTDQKNIPRTFRQRLLSWAWNLINAVIGGAATGGATILTGAAIGAASFTSRQIASAVLAGGAVALFNYIRTNRLPDMFDSSEEAS